MHEPSGPTGGHTRRRGVPPQGHAPTAAAGGLCPLTVFGITGLPIKRLGSHHAGIGEPGASVGLARRQCFRARVVNVPVHVASAGPAANVYRECPDVVRSRGRGRRLRWSGWHGWRLGRALQLQGLYRSWWWRRRWWLLGGREKRSWWRRGGKRLHDFDGELGIVLAIAEVLAECIRPCAVDCARRRRRHE